MRGGRVWGCWGGVQRGVGLRHTRRYSCAAETKNGSVPLWLPGRTGPLPPSGHTKSSGQSAVRANETFVRLTSRNVLTPSTRSPLRSVLLLRRILEERGLHKSGLISSSALTFLVEFCSEIRKKTSNSFTRFLRFNLSAHHRVLTPGCPRGGPTHRGSAPPHGIRLQARAGALGWQRPRDPGRCLKVLGGRSRTAGGAGTQKHGGCSPGFPAWPQG